MKRRYIVGIVAVCLVIFCAVLVSRSISSRNNVEVVVPAGVSGFYGISDNKLYYRVGSSLLTKDIKSKAITPLSSQANTAVMSPTNTELFYREMNNYVINGFKLDIQSGGSTKYKGIEGSAWCGQDLYVVYAQKQSGYTVKDSKGDTRFENVPTSDIYCLDGELVYSASDLSQAEDDGTLTLKYLAQNKASATINIEQQNSPLLQNAQKLSFLDSEGSLVFVNESGSTKIPLKATNAVITQYGIGDVYVVNSPSNDENTVDIYRVDVATKDYEELRSFKTEHGIEQSKAEIDTSVAFENDGYLYFVVGNSIVRAKL